MNIAILIPGFSDGERDWCIPVYLNLVHELARTDTVSVFALRYPPRRDVYTVYGATIHALGGRHGMAGGARMALWLRTVGTVRREHRRAPFDILHAIWADETALLATWTGRMLHVPVVVSIAGGELANLPDIHYGLQAGRFSRRIVSAALRTADRVTAPCDQTAALAKPFIASERLVISPLGVDTDFFTPAALTTTHRLLSVGSLTPIKNHAALLRVFAQLRTDDSTLDLIGEGPLEPMLRTLAESLGIAARVRIRGAVAHDALPSVYQASAVHVLTSRHEAFGVVVLEAAACGIPTVGYAHGVLLELAARGAGIAVTPGDETALSDALDRLLSDPALRTQMGRAARQMAVERYTLSAMTQGMQAVYRYVGRR